MMKLKANPVSGVLYDPTGIPLSYTNLYNMYGNPDDPRFATTNLVSVVHEFGGHDVHFVCHKAIAWKLHLVWVTLKSKGLLSQVKTFDGCYNNRLVRGGTQKSVHAWGMAIDINAADYPLHSADRLPHDIIVAFEEQGFWYGGDYHSRKDPMHFQWAGDI